MPKAGCIVAHKVPVAVLKAQLGQYVRRLADAIFDTAPCTGCPHNSARQAGLFSESLGEGYCQHPTHFDELTLQAVDARAAALKDEYRGGAYAFWRDMLDGKFGRFPERVLVDAKQTLGALLGAKEGA